MASEASRRIWRRSEYRVLYLGFVVTGVATSCGASLAALHLTNELGLPTSAVGLFFLVRLLAPGVSLGTGWLSDRVRDRIPLLRGCTIWLAGGWLLFSLTTDLATALVVSAVFLCFTGAVNAQLFAVANDHITAQDEPYRNTIASTLRGGNALGYVLGPVLGGCLATVLGLHAVFLATAALYVLAVVGTLWLNSYEPSSRTARPNVGRPSGRIGCRLFACGIGITLVLSGDAMKQGYLPILAIDHLGYSTLEFGVLMSVSAVVELIMFPLAGMLADKIGQARVIGVALLVGAVDYSLLASSSSIWQLYLVQVLHVAVIVGMYGVGVSYVQGISPRQPGLASSTFFAAQGVATPLGGLFGALGVGVFGLSGMFWLPAVLCLLCCAGFVALTYREKRCS